MSSESKVALVTGASGMIGSHIVDYLVDERNMFVVALDPAPPFWIKRHILNGDAVYVHGSSFDAAQVNKIRRRFDIDVIFDIDGVLGTEECMPRLDTAVNFTTIGARNIAELALDKRARVFYIATEFSTERHIDFTDGYSLSKNMALGLYKEYAKQYGLQLVIARVHHVWSERQQLLPVRKLLPTMIAYALAGKPIKIFGEKTAKKKLHYVYGGDAARVIVDCTLHGEWLKVPIFDIGSRPENFISVEELAQMVIDAVGKGKYVIVDDIRKQPELSEMATNNWTDVLGIGTDWMRLLKYDLPFVIDAFKRRFSIDDFKLAVKIFEDRMKYGV